jgi:prepilin-type N-terminal cleavage/methylation domain-containing protein
MYNVIGMWAIKKVRSGFTLIELMVSISIVAIIASSVGIISIQGNLKKARDNRRETDVETLRSALEIYRSDNNGKYPTTAAYSAGTVLTPNYLETGKVPKDPTDSTAYVYTAFSSAGGVCDNTATSCTRYEICATKEGLSAADLCASDCRGGTLGCNYRSTNP